MGELVAIIGPSGAGKSTYAREKYPEHIQLDPDPLIRAMFADYRLVWYSYMHAASRRMQATALEYLLPRGHNIVLTHDGQTRKKRQKLVALAETHKTRLSIIRLVSSPEICTARAQADTTRPKSSKAEWPRIVRNWFRDWEPVDCEKEGIAFYKEVEW